MNIRQWCIITSQHIYMYKYVHIIKQKVSLVLTGSLDQIEMDIINNANNISESLMQHLIGVYTFLY